ncbi:hypothetical protein HK405_014229, partial [Cladochytrium tenue]
MLDRVLKQASITKKDVAHWVVHPGGAPVLRMLSTPPDERKGRVFNTGADPFFLTPEQLHASWYVLENYGNTVSPSLFLVLERLLETLPPTEKPEYLVACA